MNIDLGVPAEAAIIGIIKKGYAESQTEVILLAILAYERMIAEEELALVHKAVEIEMKDIESGKSKTYQKECI